MFWLEGKVDCREQSCVGQYTKHLKKEAVGQKQGWNHQRAKTGE